MKIYKPAPIVLFVYNRLWHTKKTIEALKRNELAKESELFIYSDGPKYKQNSTTVFEVRSYLHEINGFKKITIIERNKNFGLAKSIIDGVSHTINQFGRVIVLEDDLVTSPIFLRYMNDALDLYKDNTEVVSIHGYQYPLEDISYLSDTFFIKGADCWGWATWENKWRLFEDDGQKLLDQLKQRKLQKVADFNNSYGYTKMLKNEIKGKNDSWAIKWYMSAFLHNKLTLYPKKSLVQNIGNDGSGTHVSPTDQFNIKSLSTILPTFQEHTNVSEDMYARKLMENYFNSIKLTFTKKALKKIKQIIRL